MQSVEPGKIPCDPMESCDPNHSRRNALCTCSVDVFAYCSTQPAAVYHKVYSQRKILWQVPSYPLPFRVVLRVMT